MKNYFQGTVENPYHISIGAIVKNDEGKIACHYFETVTHKSIGTMENIFLLMRETIETNETIESCLARGLLEEFGMKADLKSYVGSIVSKFKIRGTDVIMEKTTLYFLCDFVSIDESLRKASDIEATSIIQWLPVDDLIIRMREQTQRYKRDDADESSIIERVKNLI